MKRFYFKFIFLIILLNLMIFSVFAKEGRRNLSISPLALNPRNDAPIPFSLKLDWTGTTQTGRFKFVVDRFAGSPFEGSEIALVPGENHRNFTLPTLDPRFPGIKPQFKISFIGTEKQTDFPNQSIPVPPLYKRSLVIAFPVANFQKSSIASNLARNLKVERYIPSLNSRSIEGQVKTTLARFDSNETPSNPLKLCAFDILLLSGEGFAELNQRQLDAIKKWTLAGGALGVIPGDAVFENRHLTFINGLSTDEKDLGLCLDDAKRITFSSKTRESAVKLLRSTWGRIAFFHQKEFNSKFFKSESWRKSVAWLWRFRNERLAGLLETGKCLTSKEKDLLKQRKNTTYKNNLNKTRPTFRTIFSSKQNRGFSLPDEFTPQELGIKPTLINKLLSNKSRLVPFWLLVLILGLFALAVGPGDFYLLRKLKIQRLTWIFFPTASILTMGLLISISHYYLGTSDQRGTMKIMDLGEKGQILRQNSLEVLFFGQNQIEHREFRNEIFTPMLKGYEDEDEDEDDRFNNIKSFQGNFPSLYKLERSIKPWSPVLSRVMSFPNAKEDSIPWDEFDPFTKSGIENIRESLLEKIPNGKGGAYLFIWQENKTKLFDGSPRRIKIIFEDYSGKNPWNILKKISSRENANSWFGIVSSISPTGGPNFEDLSAYDSSKPDEALLIVISPRKDGFDVYRRQYSKNQLLK